MKRLNKIGFLLLTAIMPLCMAKEKGNKNMVYDLGAKRELFIDNFFINSLEGDVRQQIHKLIPEEIVLTTDERHEDSNNTSYESIVFDGRRYLFYYRAHGRFETAATPGNNRYVLCVAETTDGINFKRCQVNLSKEGYNVVLDNSMTDHLMKDGATNVIPGVTTAFYDTNPACPVDEKYKLIATNEKAGQYAMYLFVSADGFKFKQKTGRFNLAPDSGYDSANQAFFDHSIGKYRLYHRGFRNDGPTWKRTIMCHVTEDFINFTPIGKLEFNEKFDKLFAEGQELYTNGIRPYFRAPHILLGFPMRYYDGSMKPGMHLPSPYNEGTPHKAPESEWNCRIFSRPNLKSRLHNVKKMMRYALASTDSVIIASRDGKKFKGWGESLLTPPPQDDSWVYGSGQVCIGMIPTRNKFGHGAPDELSFYAQEGNWGDGCTRIRRYRIRMDGFVSLNFGIDGGTYTSPFFKFKGGRLSLNISTGAFGGFTAELRDENGKPIPGYTFEDSLPEIGDDIAMIARWKKNGPDVRSLEGKTVQLAIKARNTDIYSIAFLPYEPDPELPSYFELTGKKK
ncbi:MAG: hypothetical protein IKB71_07905 [Lentisphaeria bacterium]|nr:hypothetical protein [Lentisphaeria bacterium]